MGTVIDGKVESFTMFKNKTFRLTNFKESLHLKFCKRVLRVHLESTNLAVYGELGKYPLIIKIASLITKYWIRTVIQQCAETLAGESSQGMHGP